MILYYYKRDGVEEITTAQQYFFQYFDTPPTLATITTHLHNNNNSNNGNGKNKTRSGGNGVLNVHHDTFQKYVLKQRKQTLMKWIITRSPHKYASLASKEILLYGINNQI